MQQVYEKTCNNVNDLSRSDIISKTDFLKIKNQNDLKNLDWKFQDIRFIDLIIQDKITKTYQLNNEVTELILKYGKRVSILGIYNQLKNPNIVSSLLNIPQINANQLFNSISPIQMFAEPIFNPYDQSYIFICHVSETYNSQLFKSNLQFLLRISDLVILNCQQPEQVQYFITNYQHQPSLDKPSLFIVSNNYSYKNYKKNTQLVDIHQHFLSLTKQNNQQLYYKLIGNFKIVQFYNLIYGQNVLNMSVQDASYFKYQEKLKEIRLDILLNMSARYIDQYNLFSSNIQSYFIQNFIDGLNNPQQNLDLNITVKTFYKEIVDFAFAQSQEDYMFHLNESLMDDEPKEYDVIYNVIKACRVFAIEKFQQIAEEAHETQYYRQKKDELLQIIKNKEIQSFEINEQLSDEQCQFLFETNNFEKQFDQNQQKKQYQELTDIINYNQDYFQKALGVKAQHQFMILYNNDIAQVISDIIIKNSKPAKVETKYQEIDQQLLEQYEDVQSQKVKLNNEQQYEQQKLQQMTENLKTEQIQNQVQLKKNQEEIDKLQNEQTNQTAQLEEQIQSLKQQIQQKKDNNKKSEQIKLELQKQKEQQDELQKKIIEIDAEILKLKPQKK